MMKITRNTTIYAAVSLAVTAAYFWGVEKYNVKVLQGDRSQFMLWMGVMAALVLVGLARWLLSGEEPKQKFNLSIIYHLIATIIAGAGWLWGYYGLTTFQPIDLAWIGVIGVGSLVLRLILARYKIKGIDKKVAFK